MLNFLKLNKEISETSSALDEDDILNVKNKLKDFGYYKEPRYGMTPYSDNTMFDGIKNFQKDKSLKVDAIMKPKGETETKFNEVIKNNNLKNSGIFNKLYNKGYQIGEQIANTRNSAEMKSQFLNKKDFNDKYKHSLISCEEAQKGKVEATTIAIGGLYKEYLDQKNNKNTITESFNDLKANAYGIYTGITNSKGNCNDLVQRKYKKNIKP